MEYRAIARQDADLERSKKTASNGRFETAMPIGYRVKAVCAQRTAQAPTLSFHETRVRFAISIISSTARARIGWSPKPTLPRRCGGRRHGPQRDPAAPSSLPVLANFAGGGRDLIEMLDCRIEALRD